MKILYIGDVMGKPGRDMVGLALPELRRELAVDLVIAQAENVSHGVGMTPQHMRELASYGVDVFTGGNHTYKKNGLHELLKDDKIPVVGPANLPICPGKGYKYISTPQGDILVISLLGSIFPLKEGESISNPLLKIDEILEHEIGRKRVATIVNFHGDWSSEKLAIGHYLDGKVTAVIGDHWHIPTADARVLPKGTAHITDVGMTGSLDSCLGVKSEIILDRWRNQAKNRNDLEESKPWQLNAVLIESDAKGLAKTIQPIRHILE